MPAAISRTALATALMRSVHTRLDRLPLIEDVWGDRLVPASERDAFAEALMSRLDAAEARAQMAAHGSPQAILEAVLRAHPAYGIVIVRTRYAEDALEAAVASGVRQYVIIGAGMDSFALRRPAFARDVDVFEVDHPATQEYKRQRLEECGLPVTPRWHFVPADLAREDLGTCLAGSSFDRDRPSFFSWLGVTAYLTRDANLKTLHGVATSTLAGSGIVFTYVEQRELDSERQTGELGDVRAGVAALGEPWLSGFEPSELDGDLRAVGLELVEDLDGRALGERYCRARTDGLSVTSTVHIARARVA